jgi:hypothetical protein
MHRRLDVDGNMLVHMLIPMTPASAVFHASTFSDACVVGI